MNHRIKLITIPFRFKSSLNNLTLSKKDATKIILDAKKQKGYSFENLAKNLNVNKVWLTSAILGQHPINKELSEKLIETLDIGGWDVDFAELIEALSTIPETRGNDQSNDPVIRRLNELVSIYGDTIKTLIREEFGDGIMSAIDCTINLDKKITNDNEARVIITINGKYLQYKN